jgi:hypothetical protein
MCLSGAAYGQQPPGGSSADSGNELIPLSRSPSDAEVSKAAEGYIRLDVTVTDKAGEPVPGLGAGDFTLMDNGQVTKLVTVHAFDESVTRPDPPTEVILVIDTVNLSPQQVATADREVETFLRANDGHMAHPTMIYRLTGDALTRSAQLSMDGNQLAAEAARGDGPYTVWRQALRSFLALPEDYALRRNAYSLTAPGSITIEARRRPGRKQLLWIGPGRPVNKGGEYTLDEIAERSTRMREARIELSSLTAWPYPEMEFTDENYLRPPSTGKYGISYDLMLPVLALQSGGRVMEPAEVTEDKAERAAWDRMETKSKWRLLKPTATLDNGIEQAIQGANNFYTLTFDPPRTSTVDEYHDLKVEVNRLDVTVRARTGYFDEPVIYEQPPPRKAIALAELEEVLRNARGQHDEDLARQLNGVELTEQMTSAELTRWTAQMPGAKSRAALIDLADESAFLKPAADAIVHDAAPDIATQRQMMARTVDYVAKTIPKLPDFFATRTTVRYEEPKQKDDETWKAAVGDHILRPSETTKVTMHIRNGKEVAESEPKKMKGVHGRERDLVTEGTFGPILSTVVLGSAARHSQMAWSRWEQGPRGREAVFSYVVPQETPLFAVGFCCLADPDGTIHFHKKSGFHGEIGIDPETGAILRMEVLADLEPRLPLIRSGVVVEYAPVTIGEKVYICPTRSISISRSRTVRVLHEWNENFGVYGPFETMVNDATFSDYHVFRSTSRILTGMEAVP